MENRDYETLIRLTSPLTDQSQISDLVNLFAERFGWKPSYQIEDSSSKNFSNAHIMMEHGLQDAAVITFLRDVRYSDLTKDQIHQITTISYNNLVDWNIIVQSDEINVIYNRSSKLFSQTHVINIDNHDALRYDQFLKAISKRPSPNIATLDDVLIDRISYWKRNLCFIMDKVLSNRVLSNLFNTIFLIRSVEDYKRNTINPDLSSTFRKVIRSFYEDSENKYSLTDVIETVFAELTSFSFRKGRPARLLTSE